MLKLVKATVLAGVLLLSFTLVALTQLAVSDVKTIKIDRAAGSDRTLNNSAYCSFFGENWSEFLGQQWKDAEIQSPEISARFYDNFNDMVDLIKKYSKSDSSLNIRVASVPNAGAARSGDEKYILFNQNFFESIKRYTREHFGKTESGSIRAGQRFDWPVVGVLAHEVGHHLADHTLIGGSQPYHELQADWYSGFILQRMGAPLDQTRFLHELGPACGTLTHPSASDRLAAVTAGWVQACEIDPECDTAHADVRFETPECNPSTMASAPRRPIVTKTSSSPYEMICKVREQVWLTKKNGDVFSLRYVREAWRYVRPSHTRIDKGSAPRCAFDLALPSGNMCVEPAGTVVEETQFGVSVPIGVCAPCGPSLCPNAG